MTTKTRASTRELVATLERYGIQNAGLVVEISHEPNKPLLERCLAQLSQESGGGRNVYGGEGSTSALYERPVTEANYKGIYLPNVAAEGRNGVGPSQLTSQAYQEEADRLGGCWDPRWNMTVGFTTLHQLIELKGSAWGGYRAYNAGPAAEGELGVSYANDCVAFEKQWVDRLRGLL